LAGTIHYSIVVIELTVAQSSIFLAIKQNFVNNLLPVLLCFWGFCDFNYVYSAFMREIGWGSYWRISLSGYYWP